MILEKIKKANDIKQVPAQEWNDLAEEIRGFLINKISISGGHLASNLGVVELTMAMHLSFKLPEDKIIWDVGHQSYTHKVLTGRKDGFDELRKFGGMSGFPKRSESESDCFGTGHSSTSISAGLGHVEAREILGKKNRVISVIGDGALTGGMAYEALNNASHLCSNFIIVLNDNNMSISENVGGMSQYLSNIRTNDAYKDLKVGVEKTLSKIPVYGNAVIDKLKKTKSSIKQLMIPGMLFENMGITYLGPVDGHDLSKLIRVFHEAKKVQGAVLVHVNTKKGKGYRPAEKNPSKFHGAEPFDISTGMPLKEKAGLSYSEVFSVTLARIAKENEKIVAVTAAMPDGTGLNRFKRKFPRRFFDVGIAEEHAVTFAAGMAAEGLIPVFAVYSSFLQRSFDQIVHDVCIQNLPVIFAVDRAGLVGSDGETHQGILDLSFLTCIPNLTVMSPKNKNELISMIEFAVELKRPVAVRYPRGLAYDGLEKHNEVISYGKSEIIYDENEIALIAVGSMVKVAEKVRDNLKERGFQCSLINARFVLPLDKSMLEMASQEHSLIVTLEENVLNGGFGEKVSSYIGRVNAGTRVINIGIDNEYVEHGNVDILRKELGMDEETITKKVITEYLGVQE